MYTEDQVRSVLTSVGVKIENNATSDFVVFCPFHSNFRTPAGEVSHESGLFYCFSCKHWATFEDFLKEATGLSHFQVLRTIAKHQRKTSIVDDVESMLAATPEDKAFPEEEVERLHKAAMNSQRAVDYFKSRGLEYDSIVKHRFGYSGAQDMITMPYKSPIGDKYLGLEGRSVTGKRFKADGPKAHTLFNLNNHLWSESIMLTESIIDAVRIEQNGGRAVSSMGTARGKIQGGLLKRYFNRVFIISDVDDERNGFAGQVSAEKLSDKLDGRGIIVLPPKGFKDIGDMPDELIKKLVDNRENILEGI